jgi:serine O-acetyltransferase
MSPSPSPVGLGAEAVLGQVPVPSFRSRVRLDLDCVFERDPAARTRFEVLTTYPGLHAVFLYRIAHALWVRGWRWLPRFVSYIARIWTSIDIHPSATIGLRFFIDHGSGVVIGETAEIGDDCTLYHGVTLGGTSWRQGKRHPTLGNGVVVGAGAKILGPVTIGAGVRVGANSVVIGNVPEGRTVVGIPGKVVQTRRAPGQNPHGIDLDHHLIPDPVAGAISCLLDRIRLLEERVGTHGCIPGGTEAADECRRCDARQVCEPPELAAAPPEVRV